MERVMSPKVTLVYQIKNASVAQLDRATAFYLNWMHRREIPM